MAGFDWGDANKKHLARHNLTLIYIERNQRVRPVTGWEMTKEELEFYAEELNRAI